MYKVFERFDTMPDDIAPDKLVIIGNKEIFLTGYKGDHLNLGLLYKPTELFKKVKVTISKKKVQTLGQGIEVGEIEKGWDIAFIIIDVKATKDFDCENQDLLFMLNKEIVYGFHCKEGVYKSFFYLKKGDKLSAVLADNKNPLKGEAEIDIILILV